MPPASAPRCSRSPWRWDTRAGWAARAGPARTPRLPPPCCWWRRLRSAWCWPATCSSPAPVWTGCCSARCSASTARTSPSPPPARAWRSRRHRCARPHVDGHRVRPRRRPDARPALRSRGPGAACARGAHRGRGHPGSGGAPGRGGVRAPGRGARLLARSVPGLLAWAVGLALGEAATGLYLAYWLDAPPGPPIAVLGAAVYGALALSAALAGRVPAGATP